MNDAEVCAGACEPVVREPAPLQSCPPFLITMRDAPTKAFPDFYSFAWKLLQSNPPRVMRALAPADRDDLTSEVILHCWKNDQRVLCAYKDEGTSFATWLTAVAHNKVVDYLRQRGRRWKRETLVDDLPREGHGPVDGGVLPPMRLITDERIALVRACIGRLGDKCQVLLLASAQGFKPREMCRMLGWPPDLSKKASDDLRSCRRSLKKELARVGVDWREVLGDFEDPQR